MSNRRFFSSLFRKSISSISICREMRFQWKKQWKEDSVNDNMNPRSSKESHILQKDLPVQVVKPRSLRYLARSLNEYIPVEYNLKFFFTASAAGWSGIIIRLSHSGWSPLDSSKCKYGLQKIKKNHWGLLLFECVRKNVQ